MKKGLDRILLFFFNNDCNCIYEYILYDKIEDIKYFKKRKNQNFKILRVLQKLIWKFSRINLEKLVASFSLLKNSVTQF